MVLTLYLQTDDSQSTTECLHTGAIGVPEHSAPLWSCRITNVALHPYWFEMIPGLGLDRFCMKDVCMWMWNRQPGGTDLPVKITDVSVSWSIDRSMYCISPSARRRVAASSWCCYK